MRRPGLTGDIWPDDIQQLLLQAALLPGEPGLAAWRTVRPRIDVDHLPGELHRLMPLLSKALATCDPDDADLPRLKGVYQFSWYRNTMLFRDASALIGRLEGAGIPTMLLRGAAICAGHGDEVALRPMNDLDLLVPTIEVERARTVATVSGWLAPDRHRPLEPKLGTFPLQNAAGRIVRLHGQPSPHLCLPGAPWDDLWKRGVPARIGNTETRVPSAADHLVHACVDGAHADSGSSLRWVTDAMTLLQPSGSESADRVAAVDWDVVVAEASRLRAPLLLAEALKYLQEALNPSIPSAARQALETTSTTARDRAAHRLSLTTAPRVPPAAEILGRTVRLTAHLSIPRAVVAAPDVLATASGAEQRRALPVIVARRLARAVLSPASPRASLSEAGVPAETAGDAALGKAHDGSRLAAP